jgi:hypothetical protein
MTTTVETVATILMLIMLGLLFLAFLGSIAYSLNTKFAKKKTAMKQNTTCSKELNAHKIRLYTDYFWSEGGDRFIWISIFLIFFMFLGVSIGNLVGIIFSIIATIVTVSFFLFAYRSYINFPIKAKAKLDAFEKGIEAGINKEISFEGDNIQSFSDKDEEFDTKPQVFKFPVEVTKIPYPPFGKTAGKKPITSTQKLEFLILSREYFSICKKASKFNLLNPARAPIPKGCVELPGGGGECDEYYYSQMRNVQYDGKAIRIIYSDGQEDAVFECKKGPAQKAAMKALKEKLRLTERQKLRKIEEHKHYEDLKDKRIKPSEKSPEEEKKSE